MNNALQKQVFFVNGATGGIGSAIVERLASAQARIAISARNADRLQAMEKKLCEQGGDVLVVPADVTDEIAVAKAIAEARDHFGQLDVLINLPGLSVPAKIAEMEVADYDRIMDVNVKGAFLCSKHFLQAVDPQRGGLMIHVSSMAGKTANPNAPIYCVSKAALNMLAAGLALQAKQNNVRVTTLCPGAVSTPGFWGSRPVPHDKFLKPEDVADVVTYVVALPPHIVVHDMVFEPWEMFKSK